MADEEVRRIPLDELMELPGNTNFMSDDQFNALCEGIEQSGVVPPIVVAPRGNRYVIIDGNHRYKAARILGYDSVHAVVLNVEDEELQNILSARMNVVRGNVDKPAFTKLWLRVRQNLDEPQAMALLGITSEKQLRELVQMTMRKIDADVRARKETDVLLQRANIVQDLATLIRMAIGDGGLDEFDYLAFQLRGRDIILVRCTREQMEQLRPFIDAIKAAGADVMETILQALAEFV